MNLLLELAVNLVEHLESKEMIANSYFVALVEHSFSDELTIKERAVGGFEISYPVACDHGVRIALSPDARMQSRSAKVIDAHVRLDGAAQYHVVALERNRHSHQLSAQEHEHRAAFPWGCQRLTKRLA